MDLFKDEESLQLIVSNSPILEDQTVLQHAFVDKDKNARDFSVIILTLQRLSLDLSEIGDSCRIVIVTQS